MILNGDEIISYKQRGLIDITPWDEKRVGPNSYDVILHPTIRSYRMRTPADRSNPYLVSVLDPRRTNQTIEITIPKDGYVLRKGEFVLGATEETCSNNADDLVPMIEGRSSIGRLGLTIHVTAGFGDLGFCGRWTLEMVAAFDIILIPYMPIAQLYWIRTNPTKRKYCGKYQGQVGAEPSKIHQELGMTE